MLFRQLAEVHDWPPPVVAGLTYYQCRMYVCREEEITGVRKVSGAMGAALRRTPRKKKKLLKRFGI